ncbi:hypothetical protein VTK73DRAFT_645 [Phialemonium thermophilum]|uniref:HIG1 domain-containing protein n=1 Tax=Phialemonium thermophilum TaxID=223376 RepID=A0ABR3XED5_9PEZI
MDQPPPNLTSSPRKLGNALSKFDLGEDIDFVVGITAAALTADQLIKATHSKRHKTSHFAKASLSAAVAFGAFKMYQRDRDESRDSNPQARRRMFQSTDRRRGGEGRDHPSYNDHYLVEAPRDGPRKEDEEWEAEHAGRQGSERRPWLGDEKRGFSAGSLVDDRDSRSGREWPTQHRSYSK